MYSAKMILDSIAPCGKRLMTMEWVFPRIVLSEVNTHRVLSRSSASSRAIPVAKQIRAAIENPYVPEKFGKNRSGMQSTEMLGEVENQAALDAWLRARDYAVREAKNLMNLEVHKEYANRLLEPFLWHTAIVSTTAICNALHLRRHTAASPQMQVLFDAVAECIYQSEPQPLREGEWHMPYVQSDELGMETKVLRMISTARCARISYLNHNGVRCVESDLKLFNKLRYPPYGEKDEMRDDEPIHAGAFEHVAMALGLAQSIGNFRGWKQLRYEFPRQNVSTYQYKDRLFVD